MPKYKHPVEGFLYFLVGAKTRLGDQTWSLCYYTWDIEKCCLLTCIQQDESITLVLNKKWNNAAWDFISVTPITPYHKPTNATLMPQDLSDFIKAFTEDKKDGNL